MRHLLALGHRRIGFITGRMDIVCSRDRLQGYRDGFFRGALTNNMLVQLGNDLTRRQLIQAERFFDLS